MLPAWRSPRMGGLFRHFARWRTARWTCCSPPGPCPRLVTTRCTGLPFRRKVIRRAAKSPFPARLSPPPALLTDRGGQADAAKRLAVLQAGNDGVILLL